MITLTSGLLVFSLVATSPSQVERTLILMGTEARITVDATDRAAALAASEAALVALQTTEARLSTWRDDSELARLNRATPDVDHRISKDLATDLEAVRWCWQVTGGAFDPTIGALAEVWGLRNGGRLPSSHEIATARKATGMERLDAGPETIQRPAGMTLEEGGFGKGVGLRQAARTLAANPDVLSATLDLGGQLHRIDANSRVGAKAPWRIAVAAPADRDRPIVALTLEGGSLATSGNSERGIEAGGRRASHLLDPRTGRPAPDFGSLTVWAKDPVYADCLSTGLYILGPEAALAWTNERPGFEALVLETVEGGRIRARATAGFRHRLEPLEEGIAITFFTPPLALSAEGLITSLR